METKKTKKAKTKKQKQKNKNKKKPNKIGLLLSKSLLPLKSSLLFIS